VRSAHPVGVGGEDGGRRPSEAGVEVLGSAERFGSLHWIARVLADASAPSSAR
jgi:hypothetical protein